jgi:tRNA modification GTPase
LTAPALAKIRALLAEIEKVLAAQGQSERLRDGLVVAIAGPPNVGKSTLINQLARRDVAIVSPHAGTTRDIIEVQLDLDGYPVTVIDTAGIRETSDPVEQEGVRRARARAGEADLVLWLADVADVPIEDRGASPVWLVRNKIDLVREAAGAIDGQGRPMAEFRISARSGAGLPELVEAMVGFAQDYFGAVEAGLISRERQRTLLRETADSLQRSLAAVGKGDELVAEDLRSAAHSLGRLLGRVDVEDILDVIFREFCVGK